VSCDEDGRANNPENDPPPKLIEDTLKIRSEAVVAAADEGEERGLLL
jgi:hypothetical protein